jgi:hypothetical protein
MGGFSIRDGDSTMLTATYTESEAEQTTSLLFPYRIDQKCADRNADRDANGNLNHSKTGVCQQAVVLHIVRHRSIGIVLREKISVGNCIDQTARCGETSRHLDEDCRMQQCDSKSLAKA